jgi:hypothetical protein
MTDKSNRNKYLPDAELEAARNTYDKYVKANGELFKLENIPLDATGKNALMRKYWIAMFCSVFFMFVAAATVYYILSNHDHRPQLWVSVSIFILLIFLCYREALGQKAQTSSNRVKGIITNKFPSKYRGSSTYYLVLSDTQEIKVFPADYDMHNLGDIIEMECVSFSDPSLPRETKTLGNIGVV